MNLYQVGKPTCKDYRKDCKLKNEKDSLAEELAGIEDKKRRAQKAKDLLAKAKDTFENGDTPKRGYICVP